MNSIAKFFALAVVAGAALFATTASAHNPGFSYTWLQVNEDGMKGRLEANIVDVNAATNLDLSLEEGLTPEQEQALKDYFLSHFSIGDENGAYPMTFDKTEFMVEKQTFIVMHYTLDSPLPAPEEIVITYSAIMHAIPDHRGGFHFESNYRTGVVDNYSDKAFVHAPGRETAVLSTYNDNRWRMFKNFVIEGVEHIFIGIDHVLFLVTLLLTSVLIRKEKGAWEPTDGLKSALWNVVAIVTIFTVAHSITLAMAMKGWVSLPSRFVESVIALSILVVVIDNFYSILGRFKWSAVFIFGLFHGLGFASILRGITYDFESRLIGLIGFNIGVELGQLAIVLVLFPLLFLIRKRSYMNLILRPASIAIGVIAGWWLIQRAFDLPTGWTSF